MKTLTNESKRTLSTLMLVLAVVVMLIAVLALITPSHVACSGVDSLFNSAESALGNTATKLDRLATAVLPISIIAAIAVIMFNHDPRTLKAQLVTIGIIFAGAVIIKVVAKDAGNNGGIAGSLVNEWANSIEGG